MARLDKAQIKTLVALCGLSAATIGVAQNTPGVFYDAVSTDLGVLRGTFALHATAQQLALAASSMIVPWLLAHVGIMTLTWACSIVLVTATLAMGAANSVASFCLLGALRGFGAAICANVTITIIANNWFKRHNGAFTGATLAFSGIAGAVCAPLLARSIQAWGWRGGYVAQAALLAACMAPALVLPLSTDPALVGAKPYGVASTNDVKGGCGNDPRLSMHSPWLLVLAAFAFLHSTITGLAQHIAGYTYDLMGSYGLSVIGCLVLHAINCTLLALLLRELSLQRRRLKERVVSTTFA